MISKLVLNDTYLFLSTDEMLLRFLLVVFVGMFLGWFYTYCYFKGKIRKNKREEYTKTLSDKDYRLFMEKDRRF